MPFFLHFRRLHSNNLHCDCHLSWLSDWLRARRGLAPFTQCMAPAHMRGLNVPDVQKKDFVCIGELTLTRLHAKEGRTKGPLWHFMLLIIRYNAHIHVDLFTFTFSSCQEAIGGEIPGHC